MIKGRFAFAILWCFYALLSFIAGNAAGDGKLIYADYAAQKCASRFGVHCLCYSISLSDGGEAVNFFMGRHNGSDEGRKRLLWRQSMLRASRWGCAWRNRHLHQGDFSFLLLRANIQ